MTKKLSLVAFLMLLFMQVHAETYDIVVDIDGSGDYTTLQDAIDAVPDNSSSRTVIYIKDGTYNTEKLLIPSEKQNITFIGESREGTIISYHMYDCDDGKCPTEDAALWDDDLLYTSATLTINADGFIAKNLTIENTAGAVGQAQAITVSADKCIFINCDLTGYQDTMYFWTTDGRSYFYNCLVVGRTDYIYGGGTTFFDNCEIQSWGGGWITAPSTSEDLDYGFVFYECDITYADDSPRDGDDGSTIALGRPWHNYPKVSWLYCDMTEMIDPEGWPTTWNMDYASTSDELALYEYENTGDGADMSERADWVAIRALTDDEAPYYEREIVLAGDDDWDPLDDVEDVYTDAYSSIEAEDYSSQSGIKTEDSDEGDEDVAYIQDGDWIGFSNIDFGDEGPESFTARAATTTDATITVMIDGYSSGTEIGSCSISSTGGWQTYDEFTCDVDEVTGVHDVYLVFEGDDGYLFNLTSFYFTEIVPEASISLSASAGDGYVTLSWSTENIDIRNIQIYRDTDSDPDGRTRIATPSASATTYTDSDVTNGTTYYYWVKIVDTDLESHNSDAVGATPTSDDETSITVTTSAGDGYVTLNWSTSNIDIRNIQIMRDTDSDPSGRERIGIAGADETTYTDSDVTNGTTYYYWVKIVDTDLESYNSDAVSATPEESSTKSTGITEKSVAVKLYPNPFTDGIQLELSAPDKVNSVAIRDLMGRLVTSYDKTTIGESMVIGENLNTGIYVVQIFSENGMESYSVTKQ